MLLDRPLHGACRAHPSAGHGAIGRLRTANEKGANFVLHITASSNDAQRKGNNPNQTNKAHREERTTKLATIAFALMAVALVTIALMAVA